ncbi:MAG TPA: co-chaperone DjlA [Gammaproteobacteria bacterium]|nr:co-chaperone DjlA [Gammaproteobacteria bacterium]
MGWWGTIIGGALGWVLGGPLGALLGAALGHSLSGGAVHAGHAGVASERVQAAFFTATFSVMGHIAKADGRVSEHEIRAARAVMEHMNLSPAQQQAAMSLFNQGKQANFPLEAVLHQFRGECADQPALLDMFLQIQLHAALADGVLHPAEQAVFNRICATLGISQAELHQHEAFVRAQHGFNGGGRATPAARADKLSAAYRTLGVSPDMDDAGIKRSYRKLMTENHPDKLVAKGLPEEMMRLAQEKVQQINAAYDVIKSARGLK